MQEAGISTNKENILKLIVGKWMASLTNHQRIKVWDKYKLYEISPSSMGIRFENGNSKVNPRTINVAKIP